MSEIVPAPLDGQAALFEDPSRLLALGDGEWAQLVAQAKIATGPALAQLRRVGGLLAWAGWHRLAERNYSGLITDLADHFGVEERTIRNWRRRVVDAEHLPMPALATAKVAEAAQAAQARQTRRSGGASGNYRAPTPVRAVAPAPAPERVRPSKKPDAPRTMDHEPLSPAAAHLEEMLGWLTEASTADIAAVPPRLRKGLVGAMRRWIRALEDAPVPADVSVADCTHPVSRRIGARCAACGGKP